MGHHILVTELSTPFLNAMWWLRKLDAEGSPAYRAAAAAFVVLFFVTRLIYLPYVTFATFYGAGKPMWDDSPQVMLLMGALSALNLYWFRLIVAMLRKGKAEHPTHMSEAEWQAARGAATPGVEGPAAAATAADDSGTPDEDGRRSGSSGGRGSGGGGGGARKRRA